MSKRDRQEGRVHPLVDLARQQFAERKSDRREFLRTVTLLGVSAGAAYAMAGEILGEKLVPPAAAAQGDPVMGGVLRVSMGVQEMADPALFTEAAERALGEAVEAALDDTAAALHQHDYVRVLDRLAQVRPQVDAFFDQVMVNAEDAAIRGNRLALLKRLGDRFGAVAAIDQLSS